MAKTQTPNELEIPAPAEQETKTSRITVVSVKVKREVDLGFVPFMLYVKKLGPHKQPGFGYRDASRASFEIFMSAELGEDMAADELATQLSLQAHAIADRELRSQYPESFKAAVKAEVPEEAFVVASTTVERKVEEF
jgi:hypothetical protein